MHRSPSENIADVITRFHSEDEIIKAKDVLSTNYQGRFIYEMKNRRNTKPSKTAKGKHKAESTVDDILAVMKELDKNKIKTSFVAINVLRIPKCDPKDVDPYANLQLILSLQERLQQLEENVGLVQAQTISNTETSESNCKSIDELETAMVQMVVKPPTSDNINNVKNHLSGAGVSGSGCPYPYSNDGTAAPSTSYASAVVNSGTNTDNVVQPVASISNASSEGLPATEGSSEDNVVTPPAAGALQPRPGGAPAPPPPPPPPAGGGASMGLLQAAERRDSTASDGWTTVGRNGRPNRKHRGRGGHQHGDRGHSHSGDNRSSGGHGSGVVGAQHHGRRGSVVPMDNGDSTSRPPWVRFFGTATAATGALQGGPPPKREFFISRCHKSTQECQFDNHLKSKGLSNYEFKLMSKTVSTFKSYKLTVSIDDKDKLLQPQMWPQGVLIQKWKHKSSKYKFGDIQHG